MKAGSGSATDGATPAARLKMATAEEARIISNLVKVVEIRARGLRRKYSQWAVTSTYWGRKGGATARELVSVLRLALYTLCLVPWIRYSLTVTPG